MPVVLKHLGPARSCSRLNTITVGIKRKMLQQLQHRVFPCFQFHAAAKSHYKIFLAWVKHEICHNCPFDAFFRESNPERMVVAHD